MKPPLLDRLRDRGYRLTSQRRVVAEVLAGEEVHLTADEVHQAAAALLPEISRATVYSTLRQLVDLGELNELNLDGRSKRYDPNVDPKHHHLLCTTCGSVHDVGHHSTVPELQPDELRGMTIDSADVVYQGTCARCVAIARTTR
ncbi:MAG: transcriptional repressor [Actinobacteria bacterium]|nr:transcriptional repressor [Actinomycetota bacterium]